MYQLYAAIARFCQAIGMAIAIFAATFGVIWGLQGRGDDALLSAGIAAFSLVLVCLAGWMRKRAKKEAETLPPDLR